MKLVISIILVFCIASSCSKKLNTKTEVIHQSSSKVQNIDKVVLGNIIRDTLDLSHSKYHTLLEGKVIREFYFNSEDFEKYVACQNDKESNIGVIDSLKKLYFPNSRELIPNTYDDNRYYDPLNLFELWIGNKKLKFSSPVVKYKLRSFHLSHPLRINEKVPNASSLWVYEGNIVSTYYKKSKILGEVKTRNGISQSEFKKMIDEGATRIRFQLINLKEDILELWVVM